MTKCKNIATLAFERKTSGKNTSWVLKKAWFIF